jgi:hypothetical protein
LAISEVAADSESDPHCNASRLEALELALELLEGNPHQLASGANTRLVE